MVLMMLLLVLVAKVSVVAACLEGDIAAVASILRPRWKQGLVVVAAAVVAVLAVALSACDTNVRAVSTTS